MGYYASIYEEIQQSITISHGNSARLDAPCGTIIISTIPIIKEGIEKHA